MENKMQAMIHAEDEREVMVLIKKIEAKIESNVEYRIMPKHWKKKDSTALITIPADKCRNGEIGISDKLGPIFFIKINKKNNCSYIQDER